MYKLINERGTVHNYAGKMYWGHNIEGSDSRVYIHFDGLDVPQYDWFVFCEEHIEVGDFITRRNADHTKVLLFEVVESTRTRNVGDMYHVIANQCGYYDGNKKIIAPGYGIKPPPQSWIKNMLNKLRNLW